VYLGLTEEALMDLHLELWMIHVIGALSVELEAEYTNLKAYLKLE